MNSSDAEKYMVAPEIKTFTEINIDMDHPEWVIICRDIARFVFEIENNHIYVEEFSPFNWGIIIHIEETLSNPELMAHEWLNDIVTKAKKLALSQFQILADYKTPISTELELV